MPQPSRLRFDPLSAADASFILELVNEPGWLQHIGDRNIHDLAAAAAYIANGPANSHSQYGFGLDRVNRLDTAEPVGLCGLLQRPYLDAPDIGYAFLQRHHGQGFATEAVRAVLGDARQRLALPLLYAITSPDNDASIRVLEKCGFHFERFMLTPGATVQSRLFVLRF
ncbi:MAG: GNAT family N-acetyltransferase [Stagnimonas sp.]|nr:GNAT family N-acetyltransferase [Stagnimonas sp.]